MCRYGMYGPYKSHFACFECRKGFKRSATHADGKVVETPATCPQCGVAMSDMGLDFKPPRRNDAEHWGVVAFLFHHGFAYHSCGCGGPGFRPSRWADVPAFLESHRCRSAGELLAAKFA